MEARGEMRQGRARIGDRDHRDARRRGHALWSQHGDGAGGDGGVDEGAAIGLGAGKGCEQETSAHGAAVAGEAGDLNIGWDRGDP
jgi:hypothetical protein